MTEAGGAVFEVEKVFDMTGRCVAAGRMVSGVIRPHDVLLVPSGVRVDVRGIDLCGRPDVIRLVFALEHAPLFEPGMRLVSQPDGAPSS